MVRKNVFATTLLSMILLVSVAYGSLCDDGYHFQDYANASNVEDYGEWWYFTFTQEDLSGIIQYSLWDPAMKTEYSLGLLYVSIFLPEGYYEFGLPVPWEYIVTSDSSANLTMGPCNIAVNDGVYEVSGYAFDLQGNNVAYSLSYVQDAPSLEGFRELKMFPPDQNQEMNWYVQMPSAAVYGVVVLNGAPYVVNARGYHDHNWGAWKLYYGLWTWFQANEQGLAIVGYDFYTLRKGQLTVILDGTPITFQRFFVINYQWIFRWDLMSFYPRKTRVYAFNRQYRLSLDIATEQTAFIGRVYENPPLAWIVYESTAHFTGKLYGAGTCKSIDMQGFREFSIDTFAP